MLNPIKFDAYKLKWIAVVCMVINHMVIAWWEVIPMGLRFPMYGIGGFTFPIMAFFIVEGYRHTSNFKRYILRIFIFGLIALPFHIAAIVLPLGGGNPSIYPFLNIMFSICFGLVLLVLYDKIKRRGVFWLIYAVSVPISFMFLEWYFVGTTMVLLYHIIRKENTRRVVPPIFAGACWLAMSALSAVNPMAAAYTGDIEPLIFTSEFAAVMPTFAVGCFFAAALVRNYSGERGKKSKWLFYAFYPLHLFIIAVIAYLL